MNDPIDTGSTSRIGPVLALSYLYVPFLAFDLGWIRPAWSIPIAAASLVGFVLACRKMPTLWVPKLSSANLAKAAVCATLLGLWVWSSGIGGYVWGNIDHPVRNTMLKMLVERPWPLYSAGTPGLPPDVEPSIFTYYLGFFLVPALVGKATSLHIGFFALWCWAFLGVCLAYYLLCAKLRRILVWPVFVFVFFSGLDAVGVILRGFSNPGVIPFWSATSNFEQWSAYNYICQTTQLYWVYNQAIPAWIATALLLCELPASCMLFAAAALMLNATFAFVGVCILSLAFAWANLPAAPDGESFARKSVRCFSGFFSVPNFIGPIAVGIPCFLYLSSNAVSSVLSLYFHWTYPVFVFLEVVVLFVPFLFRLRRDVVSRTVFAALLLIPFGKIGEAPTGDFFRISIPFLFVVLSWYLTAIAEALETKKVRKVLLLVAILLVGGVGAPLHEMSRTFVRTREILDVRAYWERNDKPEALLMQYRPYTFIAPVDGNPFCRFLAKDPGKPCSSDRRAAEKGNAE